jgi:hypothetical protein
MRVINLTKGTFLRSGIRGAQRVDNELTVRLFGKVQNTRTYRHAREATDWEVTIRLDELERLVEVAETQDPVALLTKATDALPTPEHWGLYTPIEWLDGKAVTVARVDTISADATTNTINWGKAVLDDYVQAEYGKEGT